MIGNHLYVNLENYINLEKFDFLHPEICRGIATANHLAVNGLQTINPGTINSFGQGLQVNPLHHVYSQWQSLPDTDLLKQAGKNLNYNQLTAYLKFAFGGYDLYSLYKILDVDFQDTGVGEIKDHFPNLINWIFQFKNDGVFESLHSSTLMVLEAGGIPWEHCDPEPAMENEIAEFIHIRTDLDRPFYMIDPSTNNRVYMNTRVAWWDETDWHGGEPINRPSYTLRINGKFTREFREKILNG